MRHLFLLTFLISAPLFISCGQTSPPAPVLPVPTPEQVEWHKLETYAFVHFGLNTFNDLEWGYGNTPAQTFNPTNLDCEQWVRIIKQAGLKAVILTAKHHDGFCLWPTTTTDYNISNSPYKDGKGDIVRELSEACRKHGLQFGLYLSPWDRNNSEYGREAYQKIYHQQINELISNYGPLFEFWFDGANGGTGWYGGADEARSINPQEYYGYEKAREMIKSKHPSAMIFGGTVPDIRWIGNESGWAGETNWAPYSIDKERHYRDNQWGMKDGVMWLPGECDVSIRPGWFYHEREDHQVKSVPKLLDLYYRSVGHGANFLLNFPIALNGQIHPLDSARAVDWAKTLQADLNTNILKGLKPEANDSRGRLFSPAKTTDSDPETYWASSDDVTAGSLTYKFAKAEMLNRVLIQEFIALGQRVSRFDIEVMQGGKWLPVAARDSLTTIGYKRIVRFPAVEAEALRINFTESKAPLCIANVEAFCAPALLAEPYISRDAGNVVTISAEDMDALIYYSLDGSQPDRNSLKYEGAFTLDGKAEIKAVMYNALTEEYGPIASRRLDIPASEYKIQDDKEIQLFDGNVYSIFYPQNRQLELDLSSPKLISGFTYVPNQHRDATDHITNYEFYVDARLVSKGEFSNIKHNPIEQIVRFEPVRGRKVMLKATKLLEGAQRPGIAEFSLITE